MKELIRGIWGENPVLRLMLGLCPTLAVSSQAVNGIWMGIAATFVLIGSNTVISLLRNFIPRKIRIPSFIVIIAAFVTIADMTTSWSSWSAVVSTFMTTSLSSDSEYSARFSPSYAFIAAAILFVSFSVMHSLL